MRPERRPIHPAGRNRVAVQYSHHPFPLKSGLGWEIIDLDAKQHPGDSHRTNFTEVVMLSVLREQLKGINPWLEDDLVDEVVKPLTANFPSTNLLQNNRHVFNQLLENTLRQAIARVNRVGGDAKDKGFVVDYVGLGHHLKKALDNDDEREQNEVLDVLSFPEEELRELKASHDAILCAN